MSIHSREQPLILQCEDCGSFFRKGGSCPEDCLDTDTATLDYTPPFRGHEFEDAVPWDAILDRMRTRAADAE